MQNTAKKPQSSLVIEPPALHVLPILHAHADVLYWLDHYWAKLNLNQMERGRIALTQDRREFARWTGRRLNPLALGCYCYLPGTPEAEHGRGQVSMSHTASPHAIEPNGAQLALPGFDLIAPSSPSHPSTSRHRHLIFIESDLLALGREVTIAHELIHLSDRVRGRPRRHHCHGYDAIAVDEAALTERDPEVLRQLLRDETARREEVLRSSRPIKYLYACPECGKEYPRVRRYSRPVSCGACDRTYNPKFLLILKAEDLHRTPTGDLPDLDDDEIIL